MLYRIAIINDFRNTTAVIDYKKFGVTMTLGAWIHSGYYKGYQAPEDDIGIFLNYKQIARVKTYAEAYGIIDELLNEAPSEVLLQVDYLLRAL